MNEICAALCFIGLILLLILLCKDMSGDDSFERIRRITGYLVGTLDRFNNAKRAEVNDRVKHDTKISGKH